LVKLLVDEPGSGTARELYESARLRSASALGYVEAVSALTRGRNDGRFSVARFKGAIGELEAIWSEIDIHAVTSELIEDATQAVISLQRFRLPGSKRSPLPVGIANCEKPRRAVASRSSPSRSDTASDSLGDDAVGLALP
jgi:uncharacterized protein with PIN domain